MKQLVQITTVVGKFTMDIPYSYKKINLKKGELHTFKVVYYQSIVDLLFYTIIKQIYVNRLGINVFELELVWK